MYTWGYIKDVCLAKMDLDENEATVQNLLSRFPFYANEVITQVCSSIKPKYSFEEFIVEEKDVNDNEYIYATKDELRLLNPKIINDYALGIDNIVIE